MSGPRLKAIHYHLTVMDPDNERPLYAVKSETPFMRPVVGDILGNLAGPESSCPGATLRVKSVEMSFIDMGKDAVKADQVLFVYTEIVQS